MEAIPAPSHTADHQPMSNSPCNNNKARKKASKKNNSPRSPVSFRTMENYVGPTNHGRPGGLLFAPSPSAPPSLYFSCPPSLPQQPPLLPLPLPLPVSQPRFYSLPASNHNNNIGLPPTRGLSSPPKPAATTKKTNRCLTPKKPSKRALQEPKPGPKDVVSSGAVPLGPDPNDLPKDAPVVLSSSVGSQLVKGDGVIVADRFDGLPSFDDELTMMMISPPPPSSLPLPRFSLRPKKLNMRSCTAEAASAEDDGATDNLRCLLRLR